MGFDFTIAVTPKNLSIEQDIQFAKSALLYADSITLINPVAYFCKQSIYNSSIPDKFQMTNLLHNVASWLENQDYPEGKSVFEAICKLEKYIEDPKSNVAFIGQSDGEIQQIIFQICKLVDKSMSDQVGNNQFLDFKKLQESGLLNIKEFKSSLWDSEKLYIEYLKMLQESVSRSYPLLDEGANKLMASVVNDKTIDFSSVERRKMMHAGFSENIIQKLPSFDQASVDEIMDIRKELAPSISRFRSKMISYSDTLQTMPWDKDFEAECSMLYYQEVAPAIREIDELSKDNSFLKNLGGKLIMNKDFMTTAGQLAISVAAGGVIQKFAETASATPGIITGGVLAAQKLKSAYDEYSEKKKEIQRKDLYFYYQAGKKLSK